MSWFDVAMLGLCGLITVVCWLIGRAHARLILEALEQNKRNSE